MDDEKISVADLLAYIRDELDLLQEGSAAAGRSPVMRFAECELELAVQAERTGQAGLTINLLKLGGSLKKSDCHTIKVKMTALNGPPGIYDLVASLLAANESAAAPSSGRKQTSKKKQRQGKKVS